MYCTSNDVGKPVGGVIEAKPSLTSNGGMSEVTILAALSMSVVELDTAVEGGLDLELSVSVISRRNVEGSGRRIDASPFTCPARAGVPVAALAGTGGGGISRFMLERELELAVPRVGVGGAVVVIVVSEVEVKEEAI
jgi:hypothetical protein